MGLKLTDYCYLVGIRVSLAVAFLVVAAALAGAAFLAVVLAVSSLVWSCCCSVSYTHLRAHET